MRRSARRVVTSCLFLVAICHPDLRTRAFDVSRLPVTTSRTSNPRIRHEEQTRCGGSGRAFASSRSSSRPKNVSTRLPMMFHKQPGESEAAFMNRIQQLAADPKAFERAVLARDPSGGTSTALHSHLHGGTNSTTDDFSDGGDASSSSSLPRRGGYQRAEDWDREQREQERTKGAGMSWEERVQFDGQRYGNRFQQNEVLRHHLKTF